MAWPREGMERSPNRPSEKEARRLGRVIGGSLSEGLVVKLDPRIAIEGLAVGRYVVIHGYRRRFFGMITDIPAGQRQPGSRPHAPGSR
jgi:hypothetical protein